MPEVVVYHADFDGTRIAEFANPPSLKWAYMIGSKGPGTIEYSIAEADPNLLFEAFGPKNTDWILEVDGIVVDSGPIWSVNMPFSSDYINVAGKNWQQWLDQPWRGYFNYTDDIDTIIAGRDPDEFWAHFPPGKTVQDVVIALLDPISTDPASQAILQQLYWGTVWGEELVGSIDRSNNTTVLSHLQQLAAMGSPYGFDFWTDYLKRLTLVGPRRTDPAAVTPAFGFYDSDTIIDGDWTNNGPNGTDILLLDGSQNVRRYMRKTHAASIEKYRRWGYDQEVGTASAGFSIGPKSNLQFKAAANQYRHLMPQKELTLRVKPEAFTYENALMQAVDVDYAKGYSTARGYWRIDANFWITSQTYSQLEDGSGDWVCDLTLDQIYIPIS